MYRENFIDRWINKQIDNHHSTNMTASSRTTGTVMSRYFAINLINLILKSRELIAKYIDLTQAGPTRVPIRVYTKIATKRPRGTLIMSER